VYSATSSAGCSFTEDFCNTVRSTAHSLHCQGISSWTGCRHCYTVVCTLVMIT
jgi:hypothetical protein